MPGSIGLRSGFAMTKSRRQQKCVRRMKTRLSEIEQEPTPSEPLAAMLSTFCKVTASYWPGLFHCYDLPDLPRTNNE